MVDYDFIFIWRFLTIMVAILLFGYTCYAFGKSKAEIFPEDEEEQEELEAALYEAYNIGLHTGQGWPDISIEEHVKNCLRTD